MYSGGALLGSILSLFTNKAIKGLDNPRFIPLYLTLVVLTTSQYPWLSKKILIIGQNNFL